MGDVADAVETVAEHIITTHVHDNHGRDDEHLVPYRGTIDWDLALVTMQKIGYEGTYLMELADTGDAASVLEEARRARAAVRAHAGARMIVYIEDIAAHDGQAVTLRGWLHNRRSSGKIHFLTLRDGTGFIQCVMSKQAVGEEAFRRADHLSQESADRRHRHRPRRRPRARAASRSTSASLEVVAEAQDYPITPKEHGVDYLMDRRHLWIRSPRQQAILRIRHEVINAVRDFFNERGFILADTPIFTPAACEGTTTLFPVQYFDDETAYLTQSGQLYNEANAMALGRVYCFGPTFRAEKSKTRRHLTEFWMVEPEVAYATLDDVMDLAEGLVVSVVARVLERRQTELKVLERDTSKLEKVQAPFPRISYDEAAEILKKKGLPFEWGGDFGAPDETALSEEFDRPICVHRYPSAVKAFYMKPDPQRAGRRAVRRRARARRLRRDHRRRPAPRRLRPAARSGSRSTTCRRKRSSGISTCAATAACRTAASAWASSASSPGSAASITCAKRFRIRGCCTGFIRNELRVRWEIEVK